VSTGVEGDPSTGYGAVARSSMRRRAHEGREVRGLSGSRKRGKWARQGSASALVGGREGEGAPAGEAVAFNGHEAGRWNAIKWEGLIRAKQKGN
jgi:hypothetical protein